MEWVEGPILYPHYLSSRHLRAPDLGDLRQMETMSERDFSGSAHPKLVWSAIAFLSIFGQQVIAADSGVSAEHSSDQVDVATGVETFGATLDESLTVVRLPRLLEDADDNLGTPFLMSVRVSQVCQKKGCFFIARDGGSTIRISFKDYGFFVPTDISGKRVLLAGELVRRELSEEQAEHYSNDLGGQDNVIESGVVYEIVATSVQVFPG